MTKHLLLSDFDLENIELRDEYRAWLIDWLAQVESDIDKDDISSSLCLQGMITELVLFNEFRFDWLAIFEDFLTDEMEAPLAYSKKYGLRLCQFNQWYQTPIHAIHTRFWIHKLLKLSVDDLAHRIIKLIQPNGWIYNPQVSNTQLRTRMKSEYLMSFAMGIDILKYADLLEHYTDEFEATLSNQPMTVYLSAEYFRLKALEMLSSTKLAPSNLKNVLMICEAGEGYCDFSLSKKVDDYMGTAKRTNRDRVLHSPLITVYAKHIGTYCPAESKNRMLKRFDDFGHHLLNNPFNIEAFKMRDIQVPFGIDISPLELISAAIITNNINH